MLLHSVSKRPLLQWEAYRVAFVPLFLASSPGRSRSPLHIVEVPMRLSTPSFGGLLRWICALLGLALIPIPHAAFAAEPTVTITSTIVGQSQLELGITHIQQSLLTNPTTRW